MATSKPEARVLREIQELLALYANLSLVDDGKKVKCQLSGHEMPCKPEAINSYLAGKKFKKLQSSKEFDYDKYKQHLVPNKKKKHENQLFCKLTLRTLNKQPEHVLRHVNGKRFRKALARWEECKKNGQKFIPRGKRQKRDSDGDDESEGPSLMKEGESEASDDESDVDSLSDLHPAIAFESDQEVEEEEEEKDSDFDFEEEEEIDDLPPSNGKAKGKKSKGATIDLPKSGGKGKGKKSKGETEESTSKNTKGKKRKSTEHVEEVVEPIKKAKKRKSEESTTKPKKAKLEKYNSKPKKVKK